MIYAADRPAVDEDLGAVFERRDVVGRSEYTPDPVAGRLADDDVSHRRTGTHQFDGNRHDVARFVFRYCNQFLEQRLHFRFIARGAYLFEPIDLAFCRGRVIRVGFNVDVFFFLSVFVDANDRFLTALLT